MGAGDILTVFARIAEERIQNAQRRGEFDHLPGKGKPIALEDESHIPDDLRLAYKVLKNANCLPPELELEKEIHNTEQLLAANGDEAEKYRQVKRLNFLVTKLNMMRRVPVNLEKHQRYYAKVVERVGRGRSAGDTSAAAEKKTTGKPFRS